MRFTKSSSLYQLPKCRLGTPSPRLHLLHLLDGRPPRNHRGLTLRLLVVQFRHLHPMLPPHHHRRKGFAGALILWKPNKVGFVLLQLRVAVLFLVESRISGDPSILTESLFHHRSRPRPHTKLRGKWSIWGSLPFSSSHVGLVGACSS